MKRRKQILLAVMVTALGLLWVCYCLYFYPSDQDGRWVARLTERTLPLVNKRTVFPSKERAVDVGKVTNASLMSSKQEQRLQRSNPLNMIVQAPKASNDSYQLTWAAGLQAAAGNRQMTDTAFTFISAFNFISAYYDNRIHPSIVVLGYQLRTQPVDPVYCLHRYDNGKEECSTVPSAPVEMDACNVFKEFNHGVMYPYVHFFYVCKLSDHGKIPVAVAMSTSSMCHPSTTLIPVYDRSKDAVGNAEIGICVQTPVFKTDLSSLVSFIEMNKLLGVEAFTAYFIAADNSTISIMDFLRSKYHDVFDIVNWHPLFSSDKSILHYHGEILAINDCLFRNIGRVNYLIFIDIDELIVPRRHNDLKDMLEQLDTGSHLDSFVFLNHIFLESKVQSLKKTITQWSDQLCCGTRLPKYLFYFNHVNCYFKYFTRSKLIVKPLHIQDIDIHKVCKRVGNTTTHVLVPQEMGVSFHYRARPTTECHKNPLTHTYDATVDTSMDKYAQALISSINTVMAL